MTKVFSSRKAATVSFKHAATRDGRRYEDVLLLLEHLAVVE